MKKNKSKKKKLIFIILSVVIILLIFLVLFIKFDYKTIKIGNNIISKNVDNIKEYILNISSYKATVEIEVTSNKNQNKYVLTQNYVSPNIYTQEVLAPENIKGLKTSYDGKDLKIENTKLSLSSIYENYNYITKNDLQLICFIEDYKENENSIIEETEEQIILKTKSKNVDNKYTIDKELYIDRQTSKPIKMQIKDINQNVLVYILYNEIEINSITKEDILAFRLNLEVLDI